MATNHRHLHRLLTLHADASNLSGLSDVKSYALAWVAVLSTKLAKEAA
jgi:hypothetical protein